MILHSITDFFKVDKKPGISTIINARPMRRILSRYGTLKQTTHLIVDTFPLFEVQCCFFRQQWSKNDNIEFKLPGGYKLDSIPAGGWLLSPLEYNGFCYWVPKPAVLRSLDQHQRILQEQQTLPDAVHISADSVSLIFTNSTELDLFDLTIWKIPVTNTNILNSLKSPQSLELQRYYLWSSHTNYLRLSDTFSYLIHGHLYENHTVWPHYWKICSELDAHALYVILRGLELATESDIYTILKHQVLFSVISRQREDGGWYHGEWTDLMESHYRLHCGGMHLLMDALTESKDPIVEAALTKAASFIIEQRDETAIGTWFRHDSLEINEESLKKGPFTWIRSTAFGKSPTNMLVLNTHLDTTIALERYQRLTGDNQYTAHIQSAREATNKVLSHTPANWLYKPLFWAVSLTFLPAEKAANLPLPIRAFKRITWKYLIPKIYKLKAIYPRFVMPNGYIDRALSLKNLSDAYLSVNLWDLLRHRRYFPDDDYSVVIENGLTYTYNSGILDKWAEMTGKQHSLVFWAEALYQRCLVDDDLKYRHWLSEIILLLEDRKLGLPPSALGSYGETVAASSQQSCHPVSSEQIRVVNLCKAGHTEIIFINSSNNGINIELNKEFASNLNRGLIKEMTIELVGDTVTLPGKSWFIGYRTV